ncbi:thioredoxin domain-containing protein [Rhodococcus aerolatus]
MSARQPAPRPVQSRQGLVIGVVAVVVVVVVGLVFWNSQRTTTRNEGYGTATAPVTVADAVVRVGQPDAATTIDVWEDMQCPVCAQLERVYGQELAQAVDQGKVAVRYHMLHFLNPKSASGTYSDRAAGALLCAAQGGGPTGTGSAYPAYHASLFANQPAEGASSDLGNDRLAELARAAGAAEPAVQCVADGAQVDVAAAAAVAGEQQLATQLGTESIGTPTVIADGQQVNLNDSSWIANLG